MHEHDLDLIMALAEGTLDASDVPSAEAAIAACAECSEDLELQRLALGALEAAPPVAMTEMESAQMRRTLRRELGLVPAAKPARPARRWFPIGALASAAALLLALVVIGPGLDLLGPDGSDDSVEPIDVAFSATSTTAAAAEADDGEEAGALNAPDSATNGDPEEAATEPLTREDATTTTSAAAETTTTAAPAPAASAMKFSAEPNLETLEDAVIRLGITADTDLAQFEEQLRALGLAFELTTTGRAAYTQECVAAGVGSIEGVTSGYPLGEAPYGLTNVMVAVYETGSPDDVVVAVQDTTTCEVLDTSA
jgi:hypothetical protein